MTPPRLEDLGSDAKFPDLSDYIVSLDWDFKGEGYIDFIAAGRQDEQYARRVNNFNWDNFYERLGGGRFLQQARDSLREKYQYVLIDSRTGVSDTSGICTVQMPDVLVACFTLNRQSILGVASIMASIQLQRPGLRIFPVPTRLENAETDKLEAAFNFAKRTFAPLLEHIAPMQSYETGGLEISRGQNAYWGDVQTPYKTFYAFEEVPAAFKDDTDAHGTILASSLRLASWLSNGRINSLNRSNLGDQAQCAAVVSAFAFKQGEEPFLIPPTVKSRRFAWQMKFGRWRRWWRRYGYPWAIPVVTVLGVMVFYQEYILLKAQIDAQQVLIKSLDLPNSRAR